MNLYLTKISRSYVEGVMRYQGGHLDPPPVSNVGPKPLVSEELTGNVYDAPLNLHVLQKSLKKIFQNFVSQRFFSEHV